MKVVKLFKFTLSLLEIPKILMNIATSKLNFEKRNEQDQTLMQQRQEWTCEFMADLTPFLFWPLAH